MNKNPLEWIVNVFVWIMDAFSRVLVTIFDGLKNAIDHANPSIFALVATLLPLLIPLPVAFMTSHSAETFFTWQPWAANVLGFGLEGLGLLAWVKLVDAVLENSKTHTGGSVIFMYGSVAAVYELLLLFINVVLAFQAGSDWRYVVVLACVCLLPALSATLYGAQKKSAEKTLEQERAEAKVKAEQIRQEKRQDRKEAAALKIQYAKDVKTPFRKS